MAKGKRTQQVGIENTIKCKDCYNSYEPDYTNIGADSNLPILCKCKHSQYMVFYNIIEKNCINYKPKK